VLVTRRRLGLIAVLSVSVLVLGACSKDKGESTGEGGAPEAACSGDALSSDQVKLPADFPLPGEVTVRSSEVAGPSQIVEGSFDAGLQEAYDDFHRQFQTAGYKVLFDEIEADDAEISYQSADGSSTGQVALRSDCGDEETTFVHITNRPS
jgi:hypothetical protein